MHGVRICALVIAALPLAREPVMPTRAERTGFAETARYEETLKYARGLAAASPWIRATSFGVSPRGRELILLIASKEKAFTPAAAVKAGKPVVLIQAGIHAGEIDGKDAGLMLLRDIAVTKERAALLDAATILFMPIYNVDGHERFGPYNRFNQNGPTEMGWRVTARGLNLNRDYLKADAPETRAWLALFTSWWPDLTIDCHVTDGMDFQYDVTYAYEAGPNVPEPIARWIDEAVRDDVAPALARMGHRPSPYIFLRDDTDPAAGLGGFVATPRFSTGYTVLQNRPSFLVETHSFKDYETRVRATYDSLVALLEAVGRRGKELRAAVRAADETAARPGTMALVATASGPSEPFELKGLSYRREPSAISGAMRIIYQDEPIDLWVDGPPAPRVDLTVQKPIAYIVPPEWTDVIERLRAHGLALRKLTQAVTGSFDGYRLSDPKWRTTPYEGHHPVTFEATRLHGVERTFPAGSILVPMDQRSAQVAAHLLEPEGPDSLVSWGFFDPIFERKEYAEAYVLEGRARRMLDADPALREAFESALADPEFASSPSRRLEFFYRRSPWWDETIGLYPVGLVTIPWDLPSAPLP